MNQDSFIKEFGRSYIVSSLIPSAFFCFILFTLFRGFIPDTFSQLIPSNNILILGQWLLISTIPIWIGFCLFSSVDWVIKFFEGYLFPSFLKAILKLRNKKKLRKQAVSYLIIQDIRKKIVDIRTEEEKKIFNEHWEAAYGNLLSLELEMPLDEDAVMPTRLGNVLKASEIYANHRYYILAPTIWPRLFSILPSQFLKDMEEKMNHLMFLLNSAFLLYIAGGLSTIASVVGYYKYSCTATWFCNSIQKQSLLQSGFMYITPFKYLIVSAILIGFGYLIYRAAVIAAQDVGLFYRTGFDLYRLELFKFMNQTLPRDRASEQNMWNEISTFLLAGDSLDWDASHRKRVRYRYHDTKT